MQIKKQTIILSSIAFLLLTGCSNLNTDLYIKNNTEDKIKFIEQNKDNKDDLDFFEKTDTKLFNSYNSKMLKNAKIRIVNREPVNSTTPIPAMYINTNSFEELASILDEVTGIYKIIFNEDARKYLTNTIKEESIIDMSKRNFTFFELIEKVAFKYDLYFERKDNTFYFKLYEEKKYHIPTNLTFNGKNTLAEHEKYSKVIINNIKKFMKNKNEDAIIYDDITGNLYVKDTVETMKRIDKYIDDLKNLEDIHFNAEVVLIHYDSKRSSINWDVLNSNLSELNIELDNKYNNTKEDIFTKSLDQNSIVIEDKYTFQKGDVVVDKILEYLNEIGKAEIREKFNLNSYNNKRMQYELSKVNNLLENVLKNDKNQDVPVIKEFEEKFDITLLPVFDKEKENVNLNLNLNFKKQKGVQTFEIQNHKIEKPIFITKKVNNMYTIPKNSYILLGISKNVNGDLNAFDAPKGFCGSLFSSDSVEEYILLVKINTKKKLEHIK